MLQAEAESTIRVLRAADNVELLSQEVTELRAERSKLLDDCSTAEADQKALQVAGTTTVTHNSHAQDLHNSHYPMSDLSARSCSEEMC